MAARKAAKTSSSKKSVKKTSKKTSAPADLASELAACLVLFGDAKFTGNTAKDPVSRIIFSCQGDVTSPPDFDCMGYGSGPSGEVFTAVGTLDLSAFFPSGVSASGFAKAAKAVREALAPLGTSKAFAAIPRKGPVIFALTIVDQHQQVLGRIHPDGRFEAPPQR
jgi:hypothetical protein